MEYLDDMFSQFAEAFLGNMTGEGDIPFRNKIDTSNLDYSLNSLHLVDRYLKFVYKHPTYSDLEYQNVVVWGGAYVGEVIRRNAVREYHWVHYDEYMKTRESSLKNIVPLTLGTHAFLICSKIGFTLPMNKIARWLDEGDSNNVHYYASCDIKSDDLANSKIDNMDNSTNKPWWKRW